jgi:hypothetical protein
MQPIDPPPTAQPTGNTQSHRNRTNRGRGIMGAADNGMRMDTAAAYVGL